MSDGERTVLHMASRVLTAEHPVILVDEPELHMHSRLAVRFWDEAEKLRPDCRFVYVTHDLTFAVSRRHPRVIIARSKDSAEAISIDELPASAAPEILGAATLPFYARRIFFFEGEPGRGFASAFFAAWFDGDDTFAVPAGDRDAVCAAVSKDPKLVWVEFHELVRHTFRGATLSNVVAQRVRSRVRDLLDGAFDAAQIAVELDQTVTSHITALAGLQPPTKVEAMFREESERVERALEDGGREMLAVLPGKHLLSLLPRVLGLGGSAALTGLVIRSLDRLALKEREPLRALGEQIEAALNAYVPPRRTLRAGDARGSST